MEEKQKMTNTQLEAQLRSHRSKAAFGKILTYGSGAVMILSLMFGLLPLTLLFLVFALIGGYLLSTHERAIKVLLGDNIISGVLNEVFDTVDYAPFGHIPDSALGSAHMCFPFTYDKVGGSDYLKAEYKGLPIELSDIELYHVESYYDEETQMWKDNEQEVFRGQWLICDFGKELSGEVHLSANTKALRKQCKSTRIEMENPAFNEHFIVNAETAQEAYYILTPHMMEYILAASGRSGGEVYMGFLRGGKLHIAIKTGRDFFELGRSNVNTETLRRKFLDELHWFTDIIDELRLVDTLYKKETSL